MLDTCPVTLDWVWVDGHNFRARSSWDVSILSWQGILPGGRRAWQGFTWAVGPGLALIPSLTCLYSLVHVLYAAAIQPGGGSRG